MKNCNLRGTKSKKKYKMLLFLFSKQISIGVPCDVWIGACA